jgi:multiple sugar transport system substrate-binding protein
MRRVATVGVVLAALIAFVVAAAVGTASDDTSATKLTVWVGWSAGHELKEFQKVVAEYDAKSPNVEVKVVGGINDDKIIAALRSGNAPDVVSSFTSSNVGIYCSSGGWIDLAPYLKQDKIDTAIFPAAARYYTQYGGKRCALPLLADVYGFYYNKKLFKQAGLTRPPRTFSELTAYAKKLTQKNADGTLKVVGYNPNPTWYHGGAGISPYGTLIGATYFDADGKSNLSRQPGWSRLLKWQKNLIDFYGYDKLVRWQTGAGDEFSASNAFETGKLAMMLDGEWRVAFLKNEHPELQYGTAPMPVDDANAKLYGSGYINGTIIGIPKSGKNRDEAWKLVRYLTTNDHALAKFSNGIRNVPSTKSSSRSPELLPDAHFSTFLKIFTHGKSSTTPITPIGLDHLQTFTNFLAKWYAGKADDLQGGLSEVDKTIDEKIKQAGKGGGVP